MALDKNLFQVFIDKVKFKFIPVYRLKDNSIYGYKIIKIFDEAGYKNRNEVYEMALDQNIFKFFFLKIQEKAYETAFKLGYSNAKFFHTLRINYIKDDYYFSSIIESLTSRFKLKKENIIFELKGADNWKDLDRFLDVVDEEEYPILFKETAESPLNFNMLCYLEPSFIEVISFDTIKKLKQTKGIKSKIIFKIPKDKDYTNKELLELGIDLAYKVQ